MSFFIGLILVCIGLLLVFKSEWLLQNFGRVAWAEEHLGSEGGTRLFHKLLGVGFILVGFAIMTGILQPILTTSLTPIFRGAQR